MELDDLKGAWNRENKPSTQTQNITKMIQQQSKGPIASLKHASLKQMRFMLFLMVAMIAMQIRNLDNASTRIFIGTYVVFCILVATFFYFNYRITDKLESFDGDVKSSLENYVSVLSQRLKWQRIGVRAVVLIFIAMLEVLPFFLHGRMLDKWHALSPFIRFAAYAAFLLFQYFVSRSFQERKFGQHLSRLKELVKELN